jgi:hypothetical protein
MLLGILLLLFQFLIIVFGVFLFSRGQGFLVRNYGPFNWFSFFYVFWFFFPQVIALFPPHLIVGLEGEGEYGRKLMMLDGQIAITVYILAVTFGYFLGSKILRLKYPQNLYLGKYDQEDMLLIWVFYIFGVISIFYLGMKFHSSDGMRSELVKDPVGKFATAISFYGNFAFSVLASYFIIKKRYFFALAVTLLFAGAILMTGARGRLLWPLVIAFVFVSIYWKVFPLFKIAIFGALLLLVLVLLDPVMIFLRDGDLISFFERVSPSELLNSLFYRRNFDGFSNLTVIAYYDDVDYDISRLFSGARDTFMFEFYPDIYERGVGFGVTYPGSLLLSGGWFLLMLGAMLYGFLLGAVSSFIDENMNPRLLFSYLFLMTWLAAIGGNFIESADKMLIAASPGFIWLFMRRYRIFQYKRVKHK